MEGLVGPPGLPQLHAHSWSTGVAWAPQSIYGGFKGTKGHPKEATRMRKGLGKAIKEQLRVLGLFNLKETEGRNHRGLGFLRRSISHLHCLMTGHIRMGENGSGKFRLDITKRFFPQRVCGH